MATRGFPDDRGAWLSGRIELGALAGDTYSLEAVNEAIADMEPRKIVRPVIRMVE